MTTINRQFRAILGRLGVARGGNSIRELLDTLIPTKSIGPIEFDDFSQPLWGITAETNINVGRYSTCSLVSDFDLSIQKIGVIAFDATPTVANTNLLLGVPTSAYNLFEFPDLAFSPALRPSVKRFDSFSTTAVTTTNTAPLDLGCELGWTSSRIDNNTFIIAAGVPIVQSTRQQTTQEFTFDPPLILPAGLFLSLQPGFQEIGTRVTWWVREMPTSIPFGDRP